MGRSTDQKKDPAQDRQDTARQDKRRKTHRAVQLQHLGHGRQAHVGCRQDGVELHIHGEVRGGRLDLRVVVLLLGQQFDLWVGGKVGGVVCCSGR